LLQSVRLGNLFLLQEFLFVCPSAGNGKNHLWLIFFYVKTCGGGSLFYKKLFAEDLFSVVIDHFVNPTYTICDKNPLKKSSGKNDAMNQTNAI
jgi:hypothetical protein